MSDCDHKNTYCLCAVEDIKNRALAQARAELEAEKEKNRAQYNDRCRLQTIINGFCGGLEIDEPKNQEQAEAAVAEIHTRMIDYKHAAEDLQAKLAAAEAERDRLARDNARLTGEYSEQLKGFWAGICGECGKQKAIATKAEAELKECKGEGAEDGRTYRQLLSDYDAMTKAHADLQAKLAREKERLGARIDSLEDDLLGYETTTANAEKWRTERNEAEEDRADLAARLDAEKTAAASYREIAKDLQAKLAAAERREKAAESMLGKVMAENRQNSEQARAEREAARDAVVEAAREAVRQHGQCGWECSWCEVSDALARLAALDSAQNP